MRILGQNAKTTDRQVFKRKEKKYLIDRATFDELFPRLREHMDMDDFGLSTVMCLYYDTEDYQLIYRSIEKPIFKEKFRLRCYGVPRDDSTVFAEIKMKYKGIVYKRRTSAPYRSMMAFINDGMPLMHDRQIQKEIRYLFDHYDLVPKVILAYDRYSLKGRESRKLRITFDFNMRFRTHDLDLRKGDYGRPIEDRDFYIMEVKSEGGLPMWFLDILGDLRLTPGTYSKYGVCYKKYIFPELREKKKRPEE